MPWFFVIPGVLLLGGAASWYWFFGGKKLVLYTTAFAEGAAIARNEMNSSWEKLAFVSTDDLLAKLRRYGRLSRVVIIAHGGPDWFFDRSLTTARLGGALGPRLTEGAIVGLAGCSTGRSPRMPNVWDAAAFGPGGADSYAAELRDAIRAAGGPYLGEVRAHTLVGHVTANSSGREFAFARVGQPGEPWKPVGIDWQYWVDTKTGLPAHEWIIGHN